MALTQIQKEIMASIAGNRSDSSYIERRALSWLIPAARRCKS
ncbi:hypothetical protein GGD55_004037 [Rhizobium giardinii]|jgi:hypothetical protein|uniref:Uncharacterized protein n=1 Tax=Rhizobium giardinii TaxID=56731 RepID=A0A7W8XA44_9HYPH|nr:hypothetical protein [Rhizobium giardinii]